MPSLPARASQEPEGSHSTATSCLRVHNGWEAKFSLVQRTLPPWQITLLILGQFLPYSLNRLHMLPSNPQQLLAQPWQRDGGRHFTEPGEHHDYRALFSPILIKPAKADANGHKVAPWFLKPPVHKERKGLNGTWLSHSGSTKDTVTPDWGSHEPTTAAPQTRPDLRPVRSTRLDGVCAPSPVFPWHG